MAESEHTLNVDSAHYLMVHYPEQADCANAIYLDQQGQLLEVVLNVAPEQLRPPQQDAQIWLFLPAREAVFTTSPIPFSNKKARRQAVRFSLEEQLLTDVNQLQIVVNPGASNDQTSVCYIDDARLQAYVAPWLQRGMNLAGAYSDLFLIPEPTAAGNEASSASLVVTDAVAYLRTGRASGGSVATANLAQLLQSGCQQAGEHLKQLLVWGPSAALAITDSDLALVEVVSQAPTFDFMDALAKAPFTDNLSAYNLLTGGAYALPKQQKMARRLRWAKLAFGAALLLFAINQVVSLVQLQRANTHLEQHLFTLYKQVFPHARSLVAPRIRLTQQRKVLQQQQGRQHLWQLLAPLAASLQQQSEQVQLSELQYQTNALRVSVSANHLSAVTAFIKQLKKTTLHVKVLPISSSAQNARATIVLQQEASL